MGVWPRPAVGARQGVRRTLATLVVALIGANTAACSSTSDTPVPSTTTVTVGSTSPTDTPNPTTQASDAALAAYRGFWAAQVSAQADPSQSVPAELRTYAIDKALTDELSALLLFRQQGIRFEGEPQLAPTVTSVELTQPPRVMISDCVDSSNWVPVFAATGASALAPGQPARVQVDSIATTYTGRWVIRTSTVLRGRAC